MNRRKNNPGSFNLFGIKFNAEVKRGNLVSIGPNVQLTVKGSKNTYDLLPQGKIFICYSRNTSEEVHRIQNELLLENLNPDQAVEWIPMAWDVLTPINAFGTAYTAQDVINTYIQKAEHIVFVVKDYVAEGLQTEWNKFAKKTLGKTVHLCIYANENEMTVHNTLDPLKQNIHFSYSDYKDIVMYLKRKVHPRAELTGNERKLHFIQTPEQLVELRTDLRAQVAAFKEEKGNPQIILGMEKLIETIDKNGPEILMRNSKLQLKQAALIKVNPIILPIPKLIKVSPILRTKKIKNPNTGRMPNNKKLRK